AMQGEFVLVKAVYLQQVRPANGEISSVCARRMMTAGTRRTVCREELLFADRAPSGSKTSKQRAGLVRRDDHVQRGGGFASRRIRSTTSCWRTRRREKTNAPVRSGVHACSAESS